MRVTGAIQERPQRPACSRTASLPGPWEIRVVVFFFFFGFIVILEKAVGIQGQAAEVTGDEQRSFRKA